MKLGIDVVGNIAILKFDRQEKASVKNKVARRFLKENKNVRTILEKEKKFSGRLRTQKTKWLAGEKTKEALYSENGCVFRFNVDSCYFSPRLSEERKELAGKTRNKEKVLVMFGGVGPFAIVMSKISKCKVVSVELGRECNKYAKMNVKRNKVDVEVIQGDVRKVIGKGKKVKGKFDRIVMARPNLEDSFLDVAFSVIKKGGIIHYYGFYHQDSLREMKDMINRESKIARKKIRIQKVKKAGDVGAYKFRYRADIKIL